ncbi:MAG: hypothetical protein IJU02_07245 [Lachnospiraceae bacterium]|nr:hypothetical protein [Lachnospiraceae bacterium]
MKINDVLECFNAALDSERINKGIKAKGHFVSTMEIKRSMGPYKQAHVTIIYIDLDRKANIPFITSSWTERALVEHLETFKEKAEMQTLIKFIISCNGCWQQLIEGKYGIK